MKNKVLVFLLCAYFVLAGSSPTYANWFNDSLTYLKGINAITEEINPQESITFGQFAKIFVLSSTYEHGEDPIYVLKNRGFVKDSDGFTDNKLLTRADVLRIVTRGLGVETEDYIQQASTLGLIGGYPDGNLSENKNITYAEACQIIYNYKNKRESELTGEPVKLYSAEEFFKIPGSVGYSITKDGKYLIYAAPWENRLNIFKKNIQTGEVIQITKSKDRGIAGYFVKDNTVLYLRDFGGDENFHIFKTDEKGNEIDLTPFDKTLVQPLNLLEEAKIQNEILIQMNKDNKQVFDVYKLNILTGELTKVVANNGQFSGFLTDNLGKVRIASFSDGVKTGYYYRDNEDEEFRLVATYDFTASVNPIMFAEDNKTVYALSNVNRNTSALVKINPATGKEKELIFKNDKVDISGISSGMKPGTLGAVFYYTDKNNIVFLDDELKKLYQECQKILNTDAPISMRNLSENMNIAIIGTYSDVNRGLTYLYDRKKGKLELLSDANTVNTKDLAQMLPISYKSRDGLVIHGYLTIPKNTKPYNLPVIVNPHGGPWARDYWGYNTEVQYLANRGYAVLQINFRGSVGYGKKFMSAGFKQWGLNMQNDITDGVEWLKSIGLANPDKIGIYGGSYGGYATLAGITFTPDLYAAAVDYVGVSNLFTFLDTIPPYWEGMREQLYAMVGNPETDKEQFEATSPVLHVDKIKTPLFIAQGANDPRVNKAESDQMVKALKDRGIEVEYMVKDNEGHGFSNFENQLDFYKKMEQFFAEHLGGRTN